MPRPAEHVYLYEDTPHRKRWTRQECEMLLEAGMLETRDELIDGQIIIRPRYTPRHRIAIALIRCWLTDLFGPMFVSCRAPISFGEAEDQFNDAEPEASVTTCPGSAYWQRHPGPDDLVLVAEVSDSTLRFDRVAKAALYARAGIVEYWIVDIPGRQVFIHREPEAGGYTQITAYAEDESVATLARPEDGVRVADLLPPAA